MPDSHFVRHTVATAPEEARPTLENVTKGFGFLPGPVAYLAEAPQALQGFLTINGMFEKTSLTGIEREVLIMTVATRNECHYCVAMHSSMLARQNADPDMIENLRAKRPLSDARLEALRRFTHAVMDGAGEVGDAELHAFLSQGYTRRNALEVVLGIGAYTISTFANRMTAAPVDEAFRKFAWESAPA